MEAITVPGVLESLRPITEYVIKAADQAKLHRDATNRLRLAVEEIATNIVIHGYRDIDGEIMLRADMDAEMLRITLEDTGLPFNPLEQDRPVSLDQSLEEREIGGLGVYLAIQNTDKFDYQYSDGRNRNILYFERPKSTFNRTLITSKTQQVESLISEYMMSLARLKFFSDQMSNFALHPEKNTPKEVEDVVANSQKNLDRIQANSKKVFDQLMQFQKLLDVSAVISSSLELGEVLDIVMDTVVEMTGAERAYLILRSRNSDEYVVQAARTATGETILERGYAISQKVVEQVIETAKPLLINDAQNDDRVSANESVVRFDLRSVMCLPLMIHGDLLGVLYVDNSLKHGAFSRDLIPLLTMFANQAAIAIENAQLFERSQREARLERDLQIGQEIQAGFLPTQIPQAAGWNIAAYFHPARQVAGDFYDVFTMSNNKIGFVVGDVCDKGLGAALFMGLFRSLIRAFSQQHQHLGWIDTFLQDDDKRTTLEERRGRLSAGANNLIDAIVLTNDYIATNHSDANMFATVFFGMLDPRSGAFTYINAGHNPPIVIDAQGNVKEKLTTTGPAVGMMPGMEFELGQTILNPGDVLICYTDGVTEARNPSGELFSDKRLVNVLRYTSTSASETAANIKSAVLHHMNGAEQFDDITLLVVMREP